MTRAYRAVLFDLFGTVVHFAAPPGQTQRTFEWLREPLGAHRPGLDFDRFRRALFEVSAEMMASRAPEHRETPSRERFRRALLQLDAAPDGHLAAADALSLAHMAHLASQTEMPPEHDRLLRELGRRYRLGLVSNFDHAPTARAILTLHGVHDCFAVTVISDDVGLRKPHPDIFQAALRELGTAPGEALYVGDTPSDDVVGAQAVGLDVAWINRRGEPAPEPPPTYTLRALVELRDIL